MGTGALADDKFFNSIKDSFRGLDLEITKAADESIEITDVTDEIGSPYTVQLRNNPNARQEIIDYIITKKVDKGKSLVSAGVVDKTPNNTGGKTFKGLDKNGMPILE